MPGDREIVRKGTAGKRSGSKAIIARTAAERPLTEAERAASRGSAMAATVRVDPISAGPPPPARNAPCPCGSGVKAKRCHPDGVPDA